MFEVNLQTKKEQTGEALKVVRDVISKFQKDGPTAEELEASKKDVTGGFPLRTANNSDIANYVGIIGFYNLPLDYLDTFTGKINVLTREQIADAFTRRVQPDKMVTVIVGRSQWKSLMPPPRKGSSNLLRIIGGEWRSRKLPFADVPGLRPTPDRVRETLFNWLQMQVPGARCLDLFAGSGALGFRSPVTGGGGSGDGGKASRRRQSLAREHCPVEGANVVLVNDDAFRYLRLLRSAEAFDLIFLDPPFRQNLLEPILEILFAQALLKPGGMIYLEQEVGATTDFSRFNLHVHRSTQAGQVQSLLLI